VSKAIKRIFDNAEIKFTIPSESGGQKRDWKTLKPILESKFEELKRKILSDASLTEEGDGQEETERTYTIFCEVRTFTSHDMMLHLMYRKLISISNSQPFSGLLHASRRSSAWGHWQGILAFHLHKLSWLLFCRLLLALGGS
jgi:hypothetical protein